MFSNMDDNSPASESGLKKNDELVEINGNKTFQQKDSKICDFIKSSGPVMKLLVRRNNSFLKELYWTTLNKDLLILC